MALESRLRSSAAAALCVTVSAWSWGCSSPNGGGNTTTSGGANASGGSSSGGAITTGGASGGAVPVSTGGVSMGGSSSGGAMSGGSGGSAGTAAGGASGGVAGMNGGGGAGGVLTATGGVAGAAGSGGASAPAELKMPILRNGKYVLEFEKTFFEVDPQMGGRISTFSYDSKNILATEAMTGDKVNWGSTTWPSPQSEWIDDGKSGDWPPPEWIDSQPYTAALDGNVIVLSSPAAPNTGMQAKLTVVKRFSADLVARTINIDIELKNTGTTTKSWAAWQITRVGPNGLSFYPPMGAPVSNQMMTTNAAGATWYQHPNGLPFTPTSGEASGAKLVANAASPWLAHVTGGLLFVQAFPAIQAPQAPAPGEGQIELYAANTKAYVEVEPQSALTSLAAGATFTWNLRWYLRPLPSTIMATAGNAELVSFVQDLVK